MAAKKRTKKTEANAEAKQRTADEKERQRFAGLIQQYAKGNPDLEALAAVILHPEKPQRKLHPRPDLNETRKLFALFERLRIQKRELDQLTEQHDKLKAKWDGAMELAERMGPGPMAMAFPFGPRFRGGY